jgi:copper resistance protein D
MTDWGIITARFLQYGPALVLFGAPLFCLYGFRHGTALQLPHQDWHRRALLIAGIFAFCGAVWWVLAETASIFSDPGQFGSGAIWTVLSGTGFGRAAFLRIVLIGTAIASMLSLSPGRPAWIAQSVLGGAIVVSFAWTGHGVEGDGAAGLIHLGGDVVHLLAAAVWIGALFGLAMLILHSISLRTEQDAQSAYHALKTFSTIGTSAVALLILSGLINTWFLVGPRHLLQLATTTYGGLLDVKLVMFAAMLALAARNRFRLNPELGSAIRNGRTVLQPLQALRRSVLTETGLGFLILLIVSWMGTLEPPMSGG